LGRGSLITAEGKIGDDERATGGTHDGCGQANELLGGDRKGGAVPEDHVGRGIADEQQIDLGVVENTGGQAIVAG